LAATCSELDLAGSVAFYAQTRGAARSDLPAPDMLVDRLTCPMLSIFGGADEFIDSDEIEAWQGTLTNESVAHEVVVYRKLPHSFFDRRAGEFETQSDDAARRVVDFVSSVAA
ncbi:MAG: dienelactone hydrolase family protein, partial [Nakamurella sp.]